MKTAIIILIALINIPLAWHGDLTYLMYLVGVYLMITIIFKLEKLIFNKQNVHKKDISFDEYIILKNLDEELQNYYLVREEYGMYFHQNKPYKTIKNNWKSWAEEDHSLCFIGFDNLFQNIKTTDNIPKTVKDYIWEYEHGER